MWILLVKDRDRPGTEWAVHGLLADDDALYGEPMVPEQPARLFIYRTEINTPAPYTPARCWSFPDIVEATKAVTLLTQRGYDVRAVEIE